MDRPGRAALLGVAAAALFVAAMSVLGAVIGKVDVALNLALGIGVGISTAVKEYRRRNHREVG